MKSLSWIGIDIFENDYGIIYIEIENILKERVNDMDKTIIRNKLIKEVNLIPEYKLSEIYNIIHYFRIGLQISKHVETDILKFAGCWNELPEEVFNKFLYDVKNRREKAFEGRRKNERSIN